MIYCIFLFGSDTSRYKSNDGDLECHSLVSSLSQYLVNYETIELASYNKNPFHHVIDDDSISKSQLQTFKALKSQKGMKKFLQVAALGFWVVVKT